jgi:hypothetical protein
MSHVISLLIACLPEKSRYFFYHSCTSWCIFILLPWVRDFLEPGQSWVFTFKPGVQSKSAKCIVILKELHWGPKVYKHKI